MDRKTCDSFVTEALGLPGRVYLEFPDKEFRVKAFHPDNPTEFSFYNPWSTCSTWFSLYDEILYENASYESQTYFPDYASTFMEYASYRTYKGIQVTLHDLFMFATFGIETVRKACAAIPRVFVRDAIGEWAELPRVVANEIKLASLGQWFRDKSGRRFIRNYVNIDNWNKWKIPLAIPVTRNYRLAKWEEKTYTTNVSFSEPTRSAPLITIEGKNQYLRIKDLNKFLQLSYTSDSVVRAIIWGTSEPYVRFPRWISPALNFSWEIGYKWDMLSQSSVDSLPITASVILTDEDGVDATIFTETIYILGFSHLVNPLNYYAMPTETSQYVLFTPAQERQMWFLYDEYSRLYDDFRRTSRYSEEKAQAYRIAYDEWRDYITNILRDQLSDDSISLTHSQAWALVGSKPCCGMTKNSSNVFLKAGKTYSLSVEVDNVYTPLTLTEIPTEQCRLVAPAILVNSVHGYSQVGI